MLTIYNSLTKKKEKFKPICNNTVGIYVCGPTVYDLCHIGHGRTFVVFDVIIRYLRYQGYTVNYIRNITDIEDKIIERAMKNKESFQELTTRMIMEMHNDFNKLGILQPNVEPRVTKCINEIIAFIKQLIIRKHAYISTNGDVIFEINSDNHYGILSHPNLNNFYTKTRIKETIVKRKHNPVDFVLWKMSKHNEPSWPSPWGNGRPGWHIGCSVMNNMYLGCHFDIHGGGTDLIFPHHENEIAQSTCAYGEPYVNIWMHSGMVMINGEKMSKSLNNFLTIRNALTYFNSETIRFFFMSSHYRNTLNFSENNLTQAHHALQRLYTAISDTNTTLVPPTGGDCFVKKFIDAMNDDFNTPIAYSVLFSLSHEINRLKKINSLAFHGMASTLRYLANILGLLEQEPTSYLHKISKSNDVNTNIIAIIEQLIQRRNIARQAKQWKLADIIRDKLNNMGVILEDQKQKTVWRYK